MKSLLQLTGLLVCRLTLFAALAGFCVASLAAAPQPFELKDGDRVLFIGDTFFEREVDYGHIETRLTAAFPDRNVTFRNLAWAADTPLGRARASFDWNKSEDLWLARVKEQVALVKPTVAFLSYGMTAALELAEAKTPEEQEAKLGRFKTDLGKLMDAIEEVSGQKVAFVFLGPISPAWPPDPRGQRPNAPRQNLYSRSLQVLTNLQEFATRRDAPLVDFIRSESVMSDLYFVHRDPSGIHPNERGNEFFARTSVGLLTRRPQPQAETALSVLNSRFSPLRATSPNAPQAEAALSVLNSAIRQKNELFFHRWRPANWTYLLGFRKHEQGRNAVEIARFDALVEEWERKIAKLRDLNNQDPATVKTVIELTAKSDLRTPISQLKPQPLPAFDLADGFEVNLWAENPLLHKPIQMNWDPQGRLWIASSEVYPQIQPGQPPQDSIVVLEDTDADGKADKSTVFADGLLIPTGVVPDGKGGCYVAASHQLLHFADSDGDGKADRKTIVLSSFGTEDTHHNLHTLRWGYDGQLYMNQSIYTHSHVETPHGVMRLNSGGIWRFNPDTWKLEIFTKGGCNPWGHHWDQHGNHFFTDGAGFKGLYHAMEGATYFTYSDMRREAESITPGNWPKFCGLELVHSPNFPDDWQGDAITCDFRAHRLVRFKLEESGSTFAVREMPALLRTSDVNFRPIDIRFGPDGALYIADWSNPIIQHGEVDFRDPRRDKEHGRIWRVTAKARPPARKQDLNELTVTELLGRTLSRSGWEQEQARQVATLKLRAKTGEKPREDSGMWVTKQNPSRGILEALWLNESLGTLDNALSERALNSPDANVRAAGARCLASNTSLPDSIGWLAKLVRDESPRVRLEALRALAKVPSAKSAELALGVLDRPMDSTLDYALWLTINDLAEPWIAALQSGEWKPEGREKQLEFALKAIKPEQTSRVLGRLLVARPLTRDGAGPWIEVIGAAGTPKELRQIFDQVLLNGFDEPATVRALKALSEAARVRNLKPDGSVAAIAGLFENSNSQVLNEAVRLAGQWKEFGGGLRKLLAVAGDPATAPDLRATVFEALRLVGGRDVVDGIGGLALPGHDPAVRRAAALALAALDLNLGLSRVIEVLKTTSDETEALGLWREVLVLKGAGAKFRDALPETSLPPVVARAGMRAAREGGRDDVELVLALAKAGGLTADPVELSSEVIKDLAAKAVEKGDPSRGELVYRRPELACLTCHAIGGAGGKVGPDMTSIGASAPVDYLVESLLLPNAKIKEGYHAVNIEAKDGQSLTGTLARETQDEVVLRNAAGAEVRVAKNNIASRQIGTLSLMPGGLLDNLGERDKLDLVAFLSRLGKPGEFDAGAGGVARKWRIHTFVHTDQQHGRSNDVWEKPLDDRMWQPIYALANGKLSKTLLQEAGRRPVNAGTLDLFAASEIQVAKPGPVRLKLDATAGELWIAGKKAGGTGETKIELPAGTHRILVRLDPKNIPDSVRLESPDAVFPSN